MYGIDYLGGARYGKVILRHHPRGWAAGFFANTFGNPYNTIQQLCVRGATTRIRLHAVWEDDHKYRANKHNPIIAQELAHVNALKEEHPEIDFQFSPFCEHTLSGRVLSDLMEFCLSRARGVTIVNSPWTGKFYHAAGVINEVHGGAAKPKKGAYNFSFDGTPCVDADVELFKERHALAQTFFLWTSQCNGRRNPNDTTPRPERKAWPTPELIQSLEYLRNEKGLADLPKNWIWKSHAEQHEAPPESRALKPVLISPMKVSKFQLHTGCEVYESSGPLPFEDGRWRYYWPKYGYEMRCFEKNSALLVDGTFYGRVDPGFRENAYRNK